jgi:hypothetical protein
MLDVARFLAAALVLSAPVAHAAYGLAPPEIHPIGSWADAAAVGDVNGDGRDDVVVSTTFYFDDGNDYQVLVYLQQADGTLAPPLRFPYGFANRTTLAVGNLDRDAAQEIVLGHGGGIMIIDWDQSRLHQVVRSTMHTHGNGRRVTNVVLLDADRDGALDVVAHGWSEGAVIYMGDGTGGVRESVSLPTPADGYNDLGAGDFNGDGYQDFVVQSGQGETNAYVYYNDGTPSFAGPVVIDPTEGVWGGDALGVGDFNNDGRDDLALVGSHTEVKIYLQDEAGSLVYDRSIATAEFPNAMLGRDLDLDGRDDLLILHGGGGISYFLQDAKGLNPGPWVEGPYATHLNPHGMGVGDLDGDGCPDVAAANYNYGLVIHKGRGCHTVADLAVEARLGDGLLSLHLANLGERNAEAVETQVTVKVSQGVLVDATTPCPIEHRDTRSIRFTCTRDLLAGNESAWIHVPLEITTQDRRALVSVSAMTTTLTHEVELANNAHTASRRVTTGLPVRGK